MPYVMETDGDPDQDAIVFQPRSRGLPAGFPDRAFYARGAGADIPEPVLTGLSQGFSRDPKAVDGKHAGSALSLRILSSTQR
jgi:hypothetical protein